MKNSNLFDSPESELLRKANEDYADAQAKSNSLAHDLVAATRQICEMAILAKAVYNANRDIDTDEPMSIPELINKRAFENQPPAMNESSPCSICFGPPKDHDSKENFVCDLCNAVVYRQCYGAQRYGNIQSFEESFAYRVASSHIRQNLYDHKIEDQSTKQEIDKLIRAPDQIPAYCQRCEKLLVLIASEGPDILRRPSKVGLFAEMIENLACYFCHYRGGVIVKCNAFIAEYGQGRQSSKKAIWCHIGCVVYNGSCQFDDSESFDQIVGNYVGPIGRLFGWLGESIRPKKCQICLQPHQKELMVKCDLKRCQNYFHASCGMMEGNIIKTYAVQSQRERRIFCHKDILLHDKRQRKSLNVEELSLVPILEVKMLGESSQEEDDEGRIQSGQIHNQAPQQQPIPRRFQIARGERKSKMSPPTQSQESRQRPVEPPQFLKSNHPEPIREISLQRPSTQEESPLIFKKRRPAQTSHRESSFSIQTSSFIKSSRKRRGPERQRASEVSKVVDDDCIMFSDEEEFQKNMLGKRDMSLLSPSSTLEDSGSYNFKRSRYLENQTPEASQAQPSTLTEEQKDSSNCQALNEGQLPHSSFLQPSSRSISKDYDATKSLKKAGVQGNLNRKYGLESMAQTPEVPRYNLTECFQLQNLAEKGIQQSQSAKKPMKTNDSLSRLKTKVIQVNDIPELKYNNDEAESNPRRSHCSARSTKDSGLEDKGVSGWTQKVDQLETGSLMEKQAAGARQGKHRSLKDDHGDLVFPQATFSSQKVNYPSDPSSQNQESALPQRLKTTFVDFEVEELEDCQEVENEQKEDSTQANFELVIEQEHESVVDNREDEEEEQHFPQAMAEEDLPPFGYFSQ